MRKIRKKGLYTNRELEIYQALSKTNVSEYKLVTSLDVILDKLIAAISYVIKHMKEHFPKITYMHSFW